jgi:hypothetical protein
VDQVTARRSYAFTLFLGGADVLSEASADALYEGGCGDATFGERDGAQYAAFDREADSYAVALQGAIADVTKAVDGVGVVGIGRDDLVTLAAVAERAGLSREYVRLLATHKRGPGGFPAPVGYADRKTRLWDWADVAAWLIRHEKTRKGLDVEGVDLTAAVNAALSYRRHARRLSPRDLAVVADLCGGGDGYESR